MRIVHYTGVYAPAWSWGGPVRSLQRLCEALAELGHEVQVHTSTSYQAEADRVTDLGRPLRVGGVAVTYHAHEPGPGIRSRGLEQSAPAAVAGADVVHLTTVWQPLGWAGSRAARQAGVPAVVSPRGGLGTYSWSQKTWKKRIYWWLREGRICRAAAAVHYTSVLERDEAAPLGLPGQAWVVPNAIDERALASASAGAAWRAAGGVPESDLLFLSAGRLHHKKGLDLLPPVLAALPAAGPRWHWWIAGYEEDQTGPELRQAVSALGLGDRVRFLGALRDADLATAYAGADALLFPSRHENFGNVAVEALAGGAAVFLSPGVGAARDLAGAPGVTLLDRQPDPWRAALAATVGQPRAGAGERAKRSAWAVARFGRLSTARRMADLYQTLRGGGR